MHRNVFLRLRLALVAPLLLMLSWAAQVAQADDGVSGRWQGRIDIPGRPLKVVIDLEQKAPPNWIGSAIMPGLNVKGAPLTGITIGDGQISFAIAKVFGPSDAAAPKFTGRIDSSGRFVGQYQQAGHSSNFSLQKTGPADVDMRRTNAAFRDELIGSWAGEYTFGGYGRKVSMTLANGAAGGIVEWTIVGKQTTKLPIDLVTQEGDFVRLDATQPGVYFEGRFDKAHNEIQSVFVQGPFEVSFVLRKIN